MAAYIRKVKRGKGNGLWGSYVVEQDEAGTWLFTPSQSLYRGTSGDQVSFCYAGQPDPPGAPVMHLIPRNGWWFARWQDVEPGAHVAIDICTPSSRDGDTWSYDDLELDLFKFTDGRFGVVDEDEFEEARRDGYITQAEAEVCRETVTDIWERLRAGDEVFDRLGWEKLDQYGRQPFEPLVSFPDSTTD